MPHPLPEDINSVTGLKWFLVAVPDDPAFTRAAMDIYTELCNYWKWGKEGPVPEESDLAGQLWCAAVYETIEVLKMGFPEDLLGHIDDVETLLQSLIDKPCCVEIPSGAEDVVGIDEDQLPDSTVDIPGAEYPDGTGTEIGAVNALCAAANKVALVMPLLIDRIEPIFKTASDVIALATLFVILAANSIGIALAAVVAGGALITLFDIFSVWDEILELRDLIQGDEHTSTATATKNEIIAAYDDIRNAIACAGTPDAATVALHAVLDTTITSTAYRAVVKLAHNKAVMRLLFKQAANFGSETDCECTNPHNVVFGTDNFDGTFDSEVAGGCDWVTLNWVDPIAITATSTEDGMAGCGGVNHYRIYAEAGGPTEVYNSNTPPVNVVGRRISIVFNNPHTATISPTV